MTRRTPAHTLSNRKEGAHMEVTIDRGGCINTLTAYKPSPFAKANPSHTNLVEVVKA